MRRASHPRHSAISTLIIITALLFGIQASCGSSAPDSILLVVIDTLRPDHLGLYGYDRDTSPELDRWSREAFVFDQAWSTSSWTLPAFGSMLTGLEAHRHGAGRLHPKARNPIPSALEESVTTLPERLTAAGWATAAIVNNPFLHARFGLNQGFDVYDYVAADNNRLRRADTSVDRALQWMREQRGPFFLLLHLFDPHLAYDPPAEFRARFSGRTSGEGYPVRDLKSIRERASEISQAESRFIQSAYDEEIAFVDRQLGRLFEGLDRVGLSGRLLVTVTSDHGEEFFEHGGFEHGHSLHQEVVRAPLLIRGPQVAPGRTALPVSLADLAPTFLESLSLPPATDADGLSLWGLLTGAGQLPARSLRADGLLWGGPRSALLRWPHRLLIDPQTERVRLYDLRNDPLETRDVSADRPEVLKQLVTQWDAEKDAGPAWKLPDLDQETLDRLRSLGYIR